MGFLRMQMHAAWKPHCVQVLVELSGDPPSLLSILVKELGVGHKMGVTLGGGSGYDFGRGENII